MYIADIRLLFDYNYWTRDKLLACAADVSPDQFIAPTTHSWGSLRGTLVHTMDAEWGWRLRCQNKMDEDFGELKETDFPTVQAIADHWRNEELEMRQYLASLSDADMTSLVVYPVDQEVRKRVLWHVLFHMINHGMQHRSEIAHMLTQYGQSPGELDFTLFTLERPNAAQP
ncbi:MAG: DinB family protein [Anaerolineae bacterium]|nr:DinB family protein [Anaerolineae bacterium]